MYYRIRKLWPTGAGVVVSAALVSCTPSAGNGGAPMLPNTASPSVIEDRTSLPPTSPPGSAADGSDYADGQYSADGQYGTLPSTIGVTVTLVDDVITVVSVAPHATDPTSLDLQNRFADAVPAVVVGRDIDDIKVDRIAGSSATPDGFNAALERIKAEATKESAP